MTAPPGPDPARLLRETLGRRADRDHAVGMVMHRRGCSAEAAAGALADAARELGVPLHAVVAAVVATVGAVPHT